MNDRDILKQRMITLASLLEAPGGPLGASGTTLGAQLKARWSQEHKLIERILGETAQGVAVNHTLRLWHRRTEAFLKSSTADEPAWKDRQGQVWPANTVLELLADLEDRLSAWGPDGPISPAASAGDEAGQPRPGDEAPEAGAAMERSDQVPSEVPNEAPHRAPGSPSAGVPDAGP